MMYYSDEARKSAIENVKRLISKVSEIPGNVLSFADASALNHYLNDYIDIVKKEENKK